MALCESGAIVFGGMDMASFVTKIPDISLLTPPFVHLTENPLSNSVGEGIFVPETTTTMEGTTMKSTELMMALMLLSSGLSMQNEQSILGKWKGEEDASPQIEFYQEKDGSFSGKVINDTSKNPKNGHLIFKQLKYDEQSHTYKGQMMPPDAKLSINATLTFHENNRLEVVGKKFLLTKTFHFTRIQ